MNFAENGLSNQNYPTVQESAQITSCLPSEIPITEKSHNFQSEMPQILEFLPEDSVSSDSFFSCSGDFSSCGTDSGQSNSSFLSSEDSVAFDEAPFQQSHVTEENASVSACFSRSRQLACEDSMDATSREATAPLLVFSTCQQEDDDNYFLLTTAEETSMDSGLGSVESAYPNSEEESTPSPVTIAVNSSHDDINDLVDAENVSLVPLVAAVVECGSDDCVTDLELHLSTKREHEPDEDVEAPQNKVQKLEKRVSFQDVTVFYFPRKQSFVTVPSQGGSTLGMSMQHSDCETMTLQEHNYEMKLRHKEKVKEHLLEQKLEIKIKQLKYLNPDLDNGALSSMARNAIEQSNSESTVTSNDDTILNNFDEFFFLQPISAKKRRKILRLAGVDRIEGEEKLMNRILRESRESCGCTCEQVCEPETCECALSGIQCQVDRESFPCGCVVSGCQNKNGRVEFDSDRVRIHLLATMEKLRQIQEGSLVNSFVDTGDMEAAANSESECDFAPWGDVVDQSDIGIPPIANHIIFEEDDSDNICAAVCTNSSLNFQISNQIDDDHQFTKGSKLNHLEEVTESPPVEFLDTLGLKRIDPNVFFTKSSFKSFLNQQDSVSSFDDVNFSEPVPQFSSFENFSYCSTFHHKTIESLAQSIPDHPSVTINRSMYGTTSAKQNSQNESTSGDCSVLLDPIATFMTSSYNIATAESQPCTSGC